MKRERKRSQNRLKVAKPLTFVPKTAGKNFVPAVLGTEDRNLFLKLREAAKKRS
jgi:hypothetical protein